MQRCKELGLSGHLVECRRALNYRSRAGAEHRQEFTEEQRGSEHRNWRREDAADPTIAKLQERERAGRISSTI